MPRDSRQLPRHACALLLTVALCAVSGCVTRRLTVRSNPDGALVSIDDRELGTTPVGTNYLHYGTRKIRLEKDGYETLTVYEKIRAPWYDIFPIDFFTENLFPGELVDRREYAYEMQPKREVPRHELVGRADQLRALGGGGQSPPMGAVNPSFSPPAAPVQTLPGLLPPTISGSPAAPR